ncbi:XRE family transcriptional regulator [Listeria monocytogenes]|nr:helix-turn-helix transcriptional regulator [Listeria monocytogenes]MCX81771.1 XRE family transcriptional regulator [Listeria monocytogenes]TYU25378.1 helix-turn-helix transcriptional regulator [Listeria monocytogenes]TYU32117.1 helix-turn-helix transcriptional regulator [Listeria monocytogenes]
MMRKLIVGEMIDYYLKINKMSRKKLGDATGKSESAVSKWINGINTPLAKDLSIMTELFNTDIETLLYGVSSDLGVISDDEKNLIKDYRNITDRQKGEVRGMINAFLLNKK